MFQARRQAEEGEDEMTRNIGIKGVEAPKKSCEDINCPFHGKLTVRGRMFKGAVKSAKMDKSVTISFERIIKIPKFERFERRTTKLTAHSPKCVDAKEGDVVVVMECRPISKTKKFVVLKVVQ
jgi:small subunit ribosomal protein S17